MAFEPLKTKRRGPIAAANTVRMAISRKNKASLFLSDDVAAKIAVKAGDRVDLLAGSGDDRGRLKIVRGFWRKTQRPSGGSKSGVRIYFSPTSIAWMARGCVPSAVCEWQIEDDALYVTLPPQFIAGEELSND